MSDNTVSRRAVSAFLASLSEAMRGAQTALQQGTLSAELYERLQQDTALWGNPDSPLTKEQQGELTDLLYGLSGYLKNPDLRKLKIL